MIVLRRFVRLRSNSRIQLCCRCEMRLSESRWSMRRKIWIQCSGPFPQKILLRQAQIGLLHQHHQLHAHGNSTRKRLISGLETMNAVPERQKHRHLRVSAGGLSKFAKRQKSLSVGIKLLGMSQTPDGSQPLLAGRPSKQNTGGSSRNSSIVSTHNLRPTLQCQTRTLRPYSRGVTALQMGQRTRKG